VTKRLFPVDYCVALYNVVLVGVWAPLAPTEPTARWLMAAHGAALGLLWLLPRLPEDGHPVAGFARRVYPLIWIAVFWQELGLHTTLVGTAPNDVFVAALDRRLLGTHLNLVWMPAMPHLWFGEIMQFFYFSYYVLLVGVPAYLLVRSTVEASRDTVLRVSAAYLACFAIYALAPAVGPLGAFPRFPGAEQGWFRIINDALHAAGDATGTAFPSSHVAGAVTMAWLARRHGPKWLGRLAVTLAWGVVPATVYTQNHFAVDALAGGALALGVQSYLTLALTRPRLSGGRSRAGWSARGGQVSFPPPVHPEAA
jgi:hypothetical protein